MLDVPYHRRFLPAPSPWTDEKVARLKEMHAAGAAYSVVGLELGFSRSAISGMVRRLGLEKRGAGQNPLRVAAAAERAATQRVTAKRGRMVKLHKRPVFGGPIVNVVESFLWEEPPQPAEFLGIAFLDLEPGQCRFPRGEGADILFCGQERIAGKPYCRSCCRLAYDSVRSHASAARASTAVAQRKVFGT